MSQTGQSEVNVRPLVRGGGFSTWRRCLTAGVLLAFSSASYGNDADVKQLPQGWTTLAADAGLTVSGTFQHPGHTDTAVVVQNGQAGAYGLAVLPGAADDGAASIVKTFKDIKANPPHLSLVKPGSYQPVCHGGESCAPLAIANESIGLCFGEASCEIIYYAEGAYHEIHITD
ncbi:hypothetical protein GTP91_13715 [Rugamonas sp. FT82W]|uniref:Uncharacterized protein n=1 Tax=Duganella vulcania TaxID=2692166 RepID=A0A845G1P2_9BURK|nr:hypothetical protein [Duganella vulcania]MYM88234.1 hypothetical protein [Duganella vulcania]